VSTLAPYHPDRTPGAPIEVARRYLAAMRRALHPDEFPGVTERQRTDQALAATDRKER